MIRQMMAKKREASGNSLSSLEVVFDGEYRAKMLGLKSWWAMERGRKGGKVPRDFHAIIRQWIQDKKISIQPIPYIRPELGIGLTPEERGLRSATGAIVHSIMKNGTRLYREQGFDDIYSSAFEKEIANLENDIAGFMTSEIRAITRTLADGTIKQYNTID